jgi:hypothetical protein
VKVSVRIELGGGRPSHLAETRGPGTLTEERRRRARHVRHVAATEEHELRVTAYARGVEPEDGAGPHESEVTVAARHLGDSLTRARHHRRRDLDFHEQLVRLERGGKKAAEEVGRPADAHGPRASQMKHRVEGHRARGKLRGGIGVGEAPSDGAPRPGLEVADEGRGLGQERSGGGNARVALEGTLADERAQTQAPGLRAYGGKRGDAVEVHEDGRASETHVHHGHEALAARQRLGVGAVAGEKLQRLVDRARGEVFERGRTHAA